MIFQPHQRPPSAPRAFPSTPSRTYCADPTFPTPSGSIRTHFRAMAACLADFPFVRIDGFLGVHWDELRNGLQAEFDALGQDTVWLDAVWLDTATAFKDATELAALVEPYLGGADPLFGTRCPLTLLDFFDADRLKALQPTATTGRTIVYGCGAALVAGEGPLVYVDLPKDELQFRSRAGTVANLGTQRVDSPKRQYKRFYFVDWPVLNRHKSEFMGQVDWVVDGKCPAQPAIMDADTFRQALSQMSRNAFRTRPWFEPGPWGGQWIKQHLPGLSTEVPNYAWSFELITPENGVVFCDGQHRLEVSFDWLMYQEHEAVLGESAKRFGFDFPIRFDFLDTFDGGNLSIQCHPRPDYIRAHFGEPFTQDETYYILDCKPDAKVYLGFVDGILRNEFQAALLRSADEKIELDVEQFVQTAASQKHALYLIPSGTIHASGTNNLVLEISATPYIFTFKLYDWLRMDLDGHPRPLNIKRGLDNLCFERQGDCVAEALISRPTVIDTGKDWRVVHLPTHREHFYDVRRHEFSTSVTRTTAGSPQVMMLVEGDRVRVETQDMQQTFSYAETFVIPAAAGTYRLTNLAKEPAMVIEAFVKSNA
jgi:mannose-6-phosphate isomerase class I